MQARSTGFVNNPVLSPSWAAGPYTLGLSFLTSKMGTREASPVLWSKVTEGALTKHFLK